MEIWDEVLKVGWRHKEGVESLIWSKNDSWMDGAHSPRDYVVHTCVCVCVKSEPVPIGLDYGHPGEKRDETP